MLHCILPLLLAALWKRGGQVLGLWHVLGVNKKVYIDPDVLRKDALAALGVHGVDSRVTVLGSAHPSNAGRVAGKAKATAPLRILRFFIEQQLNKSNNNTRNTLIQAIREAAARAREHAKNNAMGQHAPWVAISFCPEATELVALGTEDADKLAEALIMQFASDYAHSCLPELEETGCLLHEAGQKLVRRQADQLGDAMLGGFKVKRMPLNSIEELFEALAGLLGVTGWTEPEVQEGLTEQVAGLLGAIKVTGECIPWHAYGIVYVKLVEHLVDGDWVPDKRSLYAGSMGQAERDPEQAAKARNDERETDILDLEGALTRSRGSCASCESARRAARSACTTHAFARSRSCWTQAKTTSSRTSSWRLAAPTLSRCIWRLASSAASRASSSST